MTLPLPDIRKYLMTVEETPIIALLRKQLSEYETADAESRAVLKPRILRSVENIEVQERAERASLGVRSTYEENEHGRRPH